MEPGNSYVPQKQSAQYCRLEDAENSGPTLDMSPSLSSSHMYASSNHDPSGMQNLHQYSEQERSPLVPIEAARQNMGETWPQLSEPLPEHAMTHRPQMTVTPQMMYHQGMPPPGPAMTFKEHPTMPFEFSNTGVAMPYCGNFRTHPNRPPVSAPSGIPAVPYVQASTVHYSDYLAPNRDSVTHQMFMASAMPCAEAQVPHAGSGQMFPPNSSYFGMPAAGSHGAYMNPPDFQDCSYQPQQPIPAPQSPEQEDDYKRKSPLLRPYTCHYENCEKAYTKRSHLVSHLRKHTGERPYKCKWEGCVWSFMRSDELGRHMRIHNKHRPYKCHCGREFMRSDHLRQHEKTHQRKLFSLYPQMFDFPHPGL